MAVTLRQAEAKDMEMLFKWRNIEEVVQLSRSQKYVSWEEHSEWFENYLSSDSSLILIIMNEESECGMLRFDKVSDYLEVSIYLLPGQEMQGIGTSAMFLSMSENYVKNKRIIAKIRKDNMNSIKFFRKNGFNFVKEEEGISIYQI